MVSPIIAIEIYVPDERGEVPSLALALWGGTIWLAIRSLSLSGTKVPESEDLRNL